MNVVHLIHPKTIPPTPGPWINCLLRNPSLVLRRLGTLPLATSCSSSLHLWTNTAEVMLEVRARFELGGYLASLARPFGWKACGEKRARNCTLTTTLLEAGPHLPTKTAPHPTCKLYSTKSWDLFFVCFCIKKILTDTISKTQMSLVEGTAENTWVPPERQHQGLHGPPTSPTLEQLGVWTTGSCLGLRPSPSHLGRRQERGLPPSINKCRPNPWGPGLGLSWDFQRPLQQLVSNSVQGRKDSSPEWEIKLLWRAPPSVPSEARGSAWILGW